MAGIGDFLENLDLYLPFLQRKPLPTPQEALSKALLAVESAPDREVGTA
jgi:hypothetical protein